MPSQYTKDTLPRPGERWRAAACASAGLGMLDAAGLGMLDGMPPGATPHSLTMPLPCRRCGTAVNPNVVIKEMPARTMAALAWHGKPPREAEVQAKEAELLELLGEAGLKPKGPVHCWQYDPP